jgi:hypothetical protein
LDDVQYRKPSWHAKKSDPNGDPEPEKPSSPFGAKKKPRNKPLPIAEDGYESHDSMPSLQTISDSSEGQQDISDDEFSYDEDSDEDSESEDEDEMYDEDEEDHLREMLREAMDMAAADPDFYNPRSEASYFKEAAEDKQGNSFIKLLGSLRGMSEPS